MQLSKMDKARFSTHVIEKLSKQNWTIVETTLKQFGLPEGDGTGNIEHYIASALLNHADDETLEELAVYLGAAPAASGGLNKSKSTDDLWAFEIFISHLSKHQQLARDLQLAFAGYGMKGFVAHADIEPTTAWQDEIEASLRRSDALIAMLHPGFHESKWCDQEVGFVMGRDRPAFALNFGETPYGFIGRFQAFKGTGRTVSELAKGVVEKLVTEPRTKRKAAHVITMHFAQSASYSMSTSRIELVEKLPYWDAAMVEILTTALKENSQISGEGYNRVPQRTKALIAKWSAAPPP